MKKKTAKKKQDQRQLTPTNRRAGDNGLLRIAAKLKGQVWKADPGLSQKERVFSIMACKFEKNGNRPDIENMTSSELITMYQFMRDQYGEAPFDKENAFYQIVRCAWDIANTNPDQAKLLRDIDDCYGTEDWPDLDDETDPALELREKMESQRDQLIAAVLRKHDEDETADLLMNDSAAFWDRYFQAEKAWEKS